MPKAAAPDPLPSLPGEVAGVVMGGLYRGRFFVALFIGLKALQFFLPASFRWYAKVFFCCTDTLLLEEPIVSTVRSTMFPQSPRRELFVPKPVASVLFSVFFPNAYEHRRKKEKPWTTRGFLDAQGFSVIELLVALSILSLLLGIAATTLGSLAPKFELDNTVRSVAMALNQGRSQAITRGHTVDVTFAAHSYEITDATDGDAVLATDALSTIVAVSASDVVTFTSLGMAAAPTTITVSNDSYSRNVEIGITGEVMIQ